MSAFVYNALKRIETELENKTDSKVYTYRIDFSEKTMEEILSFQKINVITLNVNRVSFVNDIRYANLRHLEANIRLDFYYSFEKDNQTEFLKRVINIGKALHSIEQDGSFMILGDFNFSNELVLFSGIVVHHSYCDILIRGEIIEGDLIC